MTDTVDRAVLVERSAGEGRWRVPKPNGARRRRRVDPGGRQCQILVRVTEEERDQIARGASAMGGLTLASYLAEVGLAAAVPGAAIGTSRGEAAGDADLTLTPAHEAAYNRIADRINTMWTSGSGVDRFLY